MRNSPANGSSRSVVSPTPRVEPKWTVLVEPRVMRTPAAVTKPLPTTPATNGVNLAQRRSAADGEVNGGPGRPDDDGRQEEQRRRHRRWSRVGARRPMPSRMPWRRLKGLGGEPGTQTSTGTIEPTPGPVA